MEPEAFSPPPMAPVWPAGTHFLLRVCVCSMVAGVVSFWGLQVPDGY